MSMPMNTGSVAGWFQDLPITDPRCNNDSCIAFSEGHRDSRREISYASQFLYGHWLMVFYCGIIFLFVLLHGNRRWKDRTPRISTSSSSTIWQKATAVLRYFSYRRLHGRVADYLDLPSFGVIFVLLSSLALSMVMVFVERPYYRSKRGYGSPPLAVRAGLMSAALIPLTVALAGKVNIISMITGLGHEKLNVFHRYVGWLMFMLSTIHTIPFFVSLYKEGGYEYVRRQFYAEGSLEFNGTPGYAFAFALAALSIPFIRRKMYEIFVWSHIAFAILFFALMFWHFSNIGDSWAYLWATLGIWLLHLAIRTLWKGSISNLRGNWFEGCRATISKSVDGTLRINVSVPLHYRWRPGQHMYLRFPYLNALDNHPFTIASTCNDIGEFAEYHLSKMHNMLFLVRPYSGATSQLARFAEKNPKMKISAAIDGPYGTRLRCFENTVDKLLLIAGGTGVSAALPILTDMSLKLADPACVTKKVHFVWMIRHSNALEWILPEMKHAISTAAIDSLEVLIYVTGETREEKSLGASDEKDSISSFFTDVEDLPGVTVRYGYRPNLLELIPTWISSGRTGVIGCGPTSLRNDLSNACATSQKLVLKDSAKEIFLHTESFDW